MSPQPHPSALPAPPWDLAPFELGNLCMLLLNVPGVLYGLAWAMQRWHRDRDGVPLALLAGGLLCTVHEPLIDVVAGCFIPYSPTWSAFTLYGRTLTWWHPLSYAVFYGLVPALLCARIAKGISATGIVVFMGSVVVFDVVMEGIAVEYGTWTFIGDQPLRVAHMPLWWGAMNCTGVLVTAVVATLLAPPRSGWHAAALAGWLPIQHVAVLAAVGWPSWAALHSEVSAPVRELAGLASYALFATIVALCIAALRRGGRLLPPASR